MKPILASIAILFSIFFFALNASADIPVSPVLEPALTLKGDLTWVTALAFSPDGKSVAVGKSYSKLHIFDVSTGTQKAESKDELSIAQFAFAPDAKTLLAVKRDGGIVSMDIASAQIHPLPDSDKVKAIAINSTGTTLAGGGDGGVITIWDPKTEKVQTTLKGAGKVVAIALADDGDTLVTQSDSTDYTRALTEVWSLKSQKIVQTTSGMWGVKHGMPIWLDKTGAQLMFWQNQSMMLSRPPAKPAKEQLTTPFPVGPVAFSADGHTVAAWETNAIDSKIYVFDTATGRLIATLTGGEQGSATYGLAISPDGKTVAAAGKPGVQIWSIATSQSPPAQIVQRFDDLWDGHLVVDRKKIADSLIKSGVPADKLESAVKDKTSYMASPQPIFDFHPDGSGSMTMVLYSKPDVQPIKWSVKSDQGTDAILQITELAVPGHPARAPYNMPIHFFSSDWITAQIDELNESPFTIKIWLRRLPRKSLAAFSDGLAKSRTAMTDATQLLATVKDAASATAAAPKMSEFARAAVDGQNAAAGVSSGLIGEPSISLAEESQAAEFNRCKGALSAAVLEIRLHADWEKPLDRAIGELRVERGADQVPDSATAAEIITLCQKDPKAASAKFNFKTLLVQGKVRQVVINGGPSKVDNYLVLVANDQPDTQPACIKCLSWPDTLGSIKPGTTVRVAGDVYCNSSVPPQVASLSGCFYARPKS